MLISGLLAPATSYTIEKHIKPPWQGFQAFGLGRFTAKTGQNLLFIAGITPLLNDLIPSLSPAAHPILSETYQPDVIQIGVITRVFQIAGSLLQQQTRVNEMVSPVMTARTGGVCP